MDPSEKEEAFFRCENNFLVKQNGYYLYYEKNPRMQAYMMEKNPDIAGEEGEAAKDDAVKAFRAIINKKKETEETEDKGLCFFLCGDGVSGACGGGGRNAFLSELSGHAGSGYQDGSRIVCHQ